MRCPYCGAENPDDAEFCEQCGTRIRPLEAPETPGAPGARQPTYWLATVALIFAVLGLLCGWSAVVGLILGVAAFVQINRSPGILGGRNYAIAAIIISIVFIIANIVVGLVLFPHGIPRRPVGR